MGAFALVFLLRTHWSVLAGLRPAGWEYWFDQGKYLRSARAFGHGNPTPSEHWYPLLYSMAIAPFEWLPPIWAAFFPDVMAYAAAFAGFAAVARRFEMPAWTALLLFLPSTVFYPWLAETWTDPWSTTLSAALIWMSLGLSCSWVDDLPSAKRPERCFALGAVLAMIPLCRPADALVSAAIATCLSKPLLIDDRRWREIAIIIPGALLPIVLYVAIHCSIYGFSPTDYMILSAVYGSESAPGRGGKAYLLFVEPRPWYPAGFGILKLIPWAPLGVAGIVVSVGEKSVRQVALLLVLPATLYLIMMVSYVDLLPSGLWRYHNIHYFKWIVPLIALFSIDFIEETSFPQGRIGSRVGRDPGPLESVRIEPVVAVGTAPARLVPIFRTISRLRRCLFRPLGLGRPTGADAKYLRISPSPGRARDNAG